MIKRWISDVPEYSRPPIASRRSRSTPNSDLTTAQVIAQFNAAYASGNANLIGQTKNQFAFLNEQGCPLN